MTAFFLLRMNDHLQYLRKFKATLEGAGDFRGTDHHACKLGQWIDGPGSAEAAALGPAGVTAFDSLAEPHERFHTASDRALAHHDAGRHDDQEREITEMHRLSTLLVNTLLEIDGLAAGTM